MCIGLPMVVEAVDGVVATCVARGCRRQVSLMLLGENAVEPGAHVLVHQNIAMDVITAEHAQLIWEAFDAALGRDSAPPEPELEETPAC